MKKVILIAIVVLSNLSITSCTADNNADSKKTSNNNEIKNADYGGNNGKEIPPPKT